MKRTLLIICTLLCANVLSAQTTFTIGDLYYLVISTNPPQVEFIGANSSANSSITTANIPETVTYQGITYSVTSIGYGSFYSCGDLTSVTIPNSVTSIGDYAFYGCSSLTSIDIPNSVTSIGEEAFSFCSSLTSANIGNGVTSIGEDAFFGCSSLTSVTLPENATISTDAFLGCGARNTGISIDNVIYMLCYDNDNIGNYTFEGVYNVTFTIGDSVYTPNSAMVYYYTSELSGDVTLLSSITNNGVSYPVTSIKSDAFENCSNLISITIPNSVTSIEYWAFGGCSNLTSVNIGNGVTSIEYDAFRNCSSLTSVNIGESVTSIEKRAFEGCSSLQNITCLATNPPTLEDNTVFPYPNIATLSVPCGILEAYSAPTSFWNMFFAGRISENGYNVEVSVNDETFGSVAVESDCSTGTLTATANDGYRFVIWNDGNTDNPRTVALTSDTAFTAIFALIDESSLAEEAEFAEISLYPNPTSSKVSFNQTIEKVEVIDLSGKTLFTFSNANSINIESLPSGAYYLRLTNNDKAIMQKVIKE